MSEEGVGKVREVEDGVAEDFEVGLEDTTEVVRLETEITLDGSAEVGMMLIGEADDADEVDTIFEEVAEDNTTDDEGAAFAIQILVLFQTVNLELPPQVFARPAKGPEVTVPLHSMLHPV